MVITPVTYRPMQPGEEGAVVALVARVYGAYVAPQYSEEGNEEFYRYLQADRLAERALSSHSTLVAVVNGEIVGAIEVRQCDHVSLLFVDGRFQGRGISRELLRRALTPCREERPEVDEITVNSSPNAVAVYERLGFRPVGEERTVNGIRFTPMALSLLRPNST